MAWYWYFLIVVVILIFVIYKLKTLLTKWKIEEISKWEVGDNLHTDSLWMSKAKDNNLKYPILVKWNENEFLINVGDDYNYLIGYGKINSNISATWRERYSRMNKFMNKINKLNEFKPKNKCNDKGEKKEFNSEMEVNSKGGQIFINDMPLVGMPQVYLNIYQGIALKEERFNLLAKINEELKKHR